MQGFASKADTDGGGVMYSSQELGMMFLAGFLCGLGVMMLIKN